MGLFNFEKIIARQKCQNITALFRLLELCFVLVMIFTFFTTYFPDCFKLSCEFFQKLSNICVSSRFILILGNMIILVLLSKSGGVLAQGSAEYGGGIKLCCEHVESSVKNQNIYGSSDRKKQRTEVDFRTTKCTLDVFKGEKNRGGFYGVRRSVLNNCWENIDYSDDMRRVSYTVHEMNSDEFRSVVESFIARRQRFLREEVFPECISF